MDRTKFYTVLTTNGVQELDFLWNGLSHFVINYNVSYYRVTEVDLLRPDLISYKVYGTIDFWWIILLVNNIDNPFKDLVVGTILQIPDKLDIYEYQKNWRVRRL